MFGGTKEHRSAGTSLRSALRGIPALDVLLGLSLALGAGLATYLIAQQLLPVRYVNDIWFHGDSDLAYTMMVDPALDTYRRVRHPLYPIATPLIVFAETRLLGMTNQVAVDALSSVTASLWVTCLFTTCRLLRCCRLDSTLVTILAAVSSAAIFWFPVPESYGLASLTILIGLLFALWLERAPASRLSFIIINAITMSMTVTNWMVGIVTTLLHQSKREATKVFALSAGSVAVLMIGYRLLRPLIFAHHHVPSGSGMSAAAVNMAIGANMGSGQANPHPVSFVARVLALNFFFQNSPGSSSRAFIFHAFVMPGINVTKYGVLTVQNSSIGSGPSPWSEISVVLWVVLLAAGLFGIVRAPVSQKFRILVALTLLGQCAIFLVFGDETFLFALHFLPLYASLIALATLTRYRYFVRATMAAAIVTIGVNNVLQIQHALALLRRVALP